MAGDFDQISAAIGELRAKAESQTRSSERIFRKLEEISESLGVVNTTKETVDRLEPLVDRHEASLRTGRGILIGVSLVSGTAGGFVAAALKKLGLTS